MSGKHSEFRISDYALDHLGDLPMLLLPTHGGKSASEKRRMMRSLSTELPDDLKQKLVSLLAAEYSKKVGGWGVALGVGSGVGRCVCVRKRESVCVRERVHVSACVCMCVSPLALAPVL